VRKFSVGVWILRSVHCESLSIEIHSDSMRGACRSNIDVSTGISTAESHNWNASPGSVLTTIKPFTL
jgi:hypothetical protein